MQRKAQVMTVGLSLFAAVSAGYVAGKRTLERVPPADVKKVVADLPDPRQVSPHFSNANTLVAAAELREKDRLDALQAQLGLQVWKLSVLPVRHAETLQLRLVVREKGKSDVILHSVGLGMSSLPRQKAGSPMPVVVSLLPQGGSLSRAKTLSLHISTDGTSMSTEADNPFLGINSWGTADQDATTVQTAEALKAPVEFPLMEVRTDVTKTDRSKPVRTLLLTVNAT